MNAASSRSFPLAVSVSRGNHALRPIQKSQTKVFRQSFVKSFGPSVSSLAGSAGHARARALARGVTPDGVLPFAVAGFRDWFLPTFARWLQLTFDNPEHVSRAFKVKHSTAVNWWNGDNRLSGDLATIAFMSFPEAVSWFLTEWEEGR